MAFWGVEIKPGKPLYSDIRWFQRTPPHFIGREAETADKILSSSQVGQGQDVKPKRKRTERSKEETIFTADDACISNVVNLPQGNESNNQDIVNRLGVTLRVIDSSHSLIPIVDAITMQDRQLQVSSIPPADRISALPDIVIDHILYFLPTKDAAATMFLLKRWKLETTLVLTIATQVR
ncbi:peptidylprolyl isomerase [Trifolium repens]|nr:peptidylprolyl isomerase [Trifolium repens]